MKKQANIIKKDIVSAYNEYGVKRVIIGCPVFLRRDNDYNPASVAIYSVNLKKATVKDFEGLLTTDSTKNLRFRYDKKRFQAALDKCADVIGVVQIDELIAINPDNLGDALEIYLTGDKTSNSVLTDGKIKADCAILKQTKQAVRYAKCKFNEVQIKYCGYSANAIEEYRRTGKKQTCSKSNRFAVAQ